MGLAVARRLQSKDGASTVLIEKHGSMGTETSSRNSEVSSSVTTSALYKFAGKKHFLFLRALSNSPSHLLLNSRR